jgi:hypothetical protein
VNWRAEAGEMDSPATEKGRCAAFFLFLSPIIRIPRPEEKTANFLWVSWAVSGLECGVVTLDFGTGG